jgi:hypothetical protein
MARVLLPIHILAPEPNVKKYRTATLRQRCRDSPWKDHIDTHIVSVFLEPSVRPKKGSICPKDLGIAMYNLGIRSDNGLNSAA